MDAILGGNEEIQERIELLIHRLHFRDLTNDLIAWRDGEADLLQGALLVARYHYPEMQTNLVFQEIEKLRRNTWLELNNYLTPLEQVNVTTGILYNYYKQKGVEFAYDNPDDYLINKTLESKKGNAVSNGIIYFRIVFHGATSQRIEVGINRKIQMRKSRVVPNHLEFGNFRKSWFLFSEQVRWDQFLYGLRNGGSRNSRRPPESRSTSDVPRFRTADSSIS